MQHYWETRQMYTFLVWKLEVKSQLKRTGSRRQGVVIVNFKHIMRENVELDLCGSE
jgi:hypothetical protein